MKHTKCYKKDYPRVQFTRQDWQNLNGLWNFKFDFENVGELQNYFNGFEPDYSINVPFAYQTPLSGINLDKRCDNVWYSKKVTINSSKKVQILHLEGCDYISKVWVNGKFIGSHKGGYTRASFDISNAVMEGENLIVVKAEDSYSCYQPRGKQRWKDQNFDCWYIDTTGIFKTVWLESLNENYIDYMRLTPCIAENSISLEGEVMGDCKNLDLQVTVSYENIQVCKNTYSLSENVFKTKIDITSTIDKFKVRYWVNHDPALYDIEYKLINNGEIIDEVGSYFGMVEYKTEKNIIYQNDTPIYLRMLLDQGYWQDGGLTPPTEDDVAKDVLLTLEAGLNGIRKHQKIEDERFYYYCDILGVSVWCEMPSAYNYADKEVHNLVSEWMQIIKEQCNHPSIMAWVPLNESWGVPRIKTSKKEQMLAMALYQVTKALDDRPCISNDGWDHVTSDILTLHNYCQVGKEMDKCYSDINGNLAGENQTHMMYRNAFANGYKYTGQPVIMSEFAGIAFKKDKSGSNWGYGELVDSQEAFINRYASLINSIVDNKGFCGYCVTQTTDVYQEVNGLLTMDREWKIPPEILREIHHGKWRK